MDFNEYQEQAKSFAVFPDGVEQYYTALGLCGEAGEVAEKVKKIIRDKHGQTTWKDAAEIAKELGDVLWYLAMAADAYDYRLDEIAYLNLAKLQSRKKRNLLGGSGDNR